MTTIDLPRYVGKATLQGYIVWMESNNPGLNKEH
jgi:hypothetical protein